MNARGNTSRSDARAGWRTVPIVMVAVSLLIVGCASVESVRGESAAQSAPVDSEAQGDWAEDVVFMEEESAVEGADYAPGDSDGSTRSAVGSAERKLVFTAHLQTRVEDVRAAVDDARRFVEARGGFVEDTNIYGSTGHESARITLRVPQDSYEDTLKHLREQAIDILDEQSSRSDVTRQYVDTAARLENLQAAESELREILAEARETGGTTEDVLAIHRELTRMRGDIDGLQAQLDALSEQVALSTINVSFEPPPAGPSEVVESWRPGEVFRQAQSDLAGALKGLINGGIYMTVAVLPVLLLIALVVAIVFVIVRAVVRRLRGTSDVG